MAVYTPPPDGFRTFLIMWATQSASFVGTQVTFFALNIWMAQTLYPLASQKAQLAGALSATTLAFALSSVFGAPFAGAWADRHDRRRMMIGADLAAGVLSFVLVMALARGSLALPVLIVLMLGYGFASAIHAGSFDTSYAMLVSREQLPRANAMMSMVFGLGGIIAPGIAATLIALPGFARHGGWPWPFALLAGVRHGAAVAISVDMVTFFVAALILFGLRIGSPQRDAGRPRTSMWAELREGGAFLARQRALLALVGLFALANLAFAFFAVLSTLLVKFDFAPDWTRRGLSFEGALALFTTIGGAGGIAGGVLMSVWGGLKQRRVLGVLVPLAVMGLAQIAVGLAPSLLFASGALAVLEAMVPFANAHSMAIWQSLTPHELQGRVLATRRMIGQGTYPLGTAIAGWAAGVYDAGAVTAVFGALLLLLTVSQFFNVALLRAEDPAPAGS